MKSLSQIISIIFLSLSSTITFAQKQKDYSTKIDSLVNTTSPRIFNGVIFATKNGKGIYSKVYGYSNFDSKVPLQLNSTFKIMSNSKQITAVLLLKQVEKGTVNLQAPIKKYLPYLNQTWADTVTVHQLLNHTHGIIDLEKQLAFEPGSNFKYGNLSNQLLGKIIEFSSKKSYAEMATILFKQLKMTRTFCYSNKNKHSAVSGYVNNKNSFKIVTHSQITQESIAADGIISTVNDLAIWNDNLHQGKILKAETYQLMTTYTTASQHDVFDTVKIGYGYGIRINDQADPKFIGHTGLGDGFASMNLYFPESDVSVVVLENQTNEIFELNYYFEKEIRKIVSESSLTKIAAP